MIPLKVKSVFKRRVVAFLASGLLAFYIGLARLFARVQEIDLNVLRKAEAGGKGVICLFWHERLLLAPVMAKAVNSPVSMLVSANHDGDIISRGINIPNLSFIRGSAANPNKPQKDKQGAWALFQIMGVLRKGGIVAITPDGPRGPARQLQQGIIELASRTGAPVILFGLSAKTGKQLKSWDKNYIVNPFSKKIALCAEMVAIPREASPEQMEGYRVEVETKLNEITRQADKKIGKKGWENDIGAS